MTDHRRTTAAAAVVAAVLLLGGCAIGGPDDEMTRPSASRTTTLPPAPTPAGAERIPVGQAGITPGESVEVTGSVIRVGGRGADVSPLQIDGYVVTPGGVYFRNETELWFTDLTSARAAGFADVSDLHVSADGRVLRFRDRSAGSVRSFDTTTGRPVGGSRG